MKVSTKSREKRNILIIGLGNIAFRYDFQVNSQQKKTHLSGILEFAEKHNESIQVYGVDPNQDKREEFVLTSSDLGTETFSGVELLPDVLFDLVLICCPMQTLQSELKKVLIFLRFSKILIEKPGAISVSQVREFENLELNKDGIVIGYPRRCLPSLIRVREELSLFLDEDWKVNITYSGETLNILSHFLDLVEYILGEFELFTMSGKSGDYFFEGKGVKNPKSRITIRQTSEQNRNDHTITFSGPRSLSYDESANFFLRCASDSGVPAIIGHKSELDAMIQLECEDYLAWAFYGHESKLANGFSLTFFSLLVALERQQLEE
jgi:predicted dehydrogenase